MVADEATQDVEIKEPEVKATGEAPPEKEKPLSGFSVQLMPDGVINRSIYGTQQNVATLFGLVEIMRREIEAIASGMPGNALTREARLLSNAVTSIGNIANVLIGMQTEIKNIAAQLEESVDAKPE